MKFNGIHFHFIGIGGISLSALALLTIARGAVVSGSDIVESDQTLTLKTAGAKIFIGHDARNVMGASVVVYSSAIKEENPEIIYAKKHNIKLIKRAELLAAIAKEYPVTVAIAGSHGKTTTTAMISQILINAGFDPTVHVGGEFRYIGGNVKIGGGGVFVTEACEYMDNFLYLTPTVGVCLNVSPDHLDYFKTFNNIQTSFKKFISQSEIVISNADDATLGLNKHNLTFSINNKGQLCAVNICEYKPGLFSFDCLYDGAIITRIYLNIYGKHNIYNALAAIGVGILFKIDIKFIKKSIEHFSGVGRRFEQIGEINGAKIIIDYAHHPDEIAASIKAAAKITSNRVIAIFQPHTFTRTQALLKEFAASLAEASEVAVFKIYSAREKPIDGVDNRLLSNEVNKLGTPSVSIDDYQTLKEFIASRSVSGDVILILGAGDYVKACKELPFDE